MLIQEVSTTTGIGPMQLGGHGKRVRRAEREQVDNHKPESCHPASHDAQMLALSVVQSSPVAAVPLAHVHVLRLSKQAVAQSAPHAVFAPIPVAYRFPAGTLAPQVKS